MPTIYNDDARTLGYWFDENNGINNMHGIFKIMTILEETGYTADLGNPITIWKMPVQDTETYKGLDYPELDYMYLARSSFKWVREYYLKRWVNRSPQPRFDAVKSITRMYSKKWLDLWETMFYDFNPIENYNMVEEALVDTTRLKHGLKTEYKGSENNESEMTSRIKAFDASATWKDSDKTNGSNTLSYQNRSDENSGTDTTEHDYKFTRSGNIGVLTTQQMIEQQRKLLMYNYFDEIVFPDIDKVLTLSVY